MMSFYQLLCRIQENPGAFIGAPSVSGLFLFLAGYQFSRSEQRVPVTAEEEAFAGFQPWLQQRFGLETTASWVKILVLQAADEVGEFKLSFELLDDFVEFSSVKSPSAVLNGGRRAEQEAIANLTTSASAVKS